MEAKVNRLSLVVILTLLYISSSAQLQEKQLIQIFDHDKNLCLEKIISNGNDDNSFRFFSSDKSYYLVELVFDSSNSNIRSFQKLKSFYEASLQEKDSTTFIIVFFVDDSMKYKEWRVLYNNDFACLSAFKRRIKIGDELKTSIKNAISSKKYKKPFVLIKEWKCSTTPLWSTFGD